MAKTSDKRYFKLGKKASTFVDPKSGLKILNKEVVEIDSTHVKHSANVEKALEGGHIKEVEASDHAEYLSTLKKDKRKEVKTAETEADEKVKAEKEERRKAKKEAEEEAKKKDK